MNAIETNAENPALTIIMRMHTRIMLCIKSIFRIESKLMMISPKHPEMVRKLMTESLLTLQVLRIQTPKLLQTTDEMFAANPIIYIYFAE